MSSLPGMFRTALHRSVPDSLRAQWEGLWQASRTANLENSPDWFDAACEAFRYGERAILAVYDTRSEELVAIAPLVKVRLYGLPVWIMPGLSFTTHAVILGDFLRDGLAEEIVAEMQKLGTVYLTGLTHEQADALSRSGRQMSVFPSDREYVMDASKGTLGEFPKKKARSILNRAARSPERVHIVTEDNSAAALQLCFDIDRASAKHRQGKGVFWKDSARLFYTLLAEKRPPCISIAVLYVGGTPVAYDMQFVCKGTRIGTQKAYLPEYGYYNPGFLTFIKRVESTLSDNPSEISLGKGGGRFKTDFTNHMRVLHSAVVADRYATRLFLAFMLSAREKVYHAVVAHPRLYARCKHLKDALIRA